jgi:hypothetical protein
LGFNAVAPFAFLHGLSTRLVLYRWGMTKFRICLRVAFALFGSVLLPAFAADFNGDGNRIWSGVAFRQRGVWQMNGRAVASRATLPTAPSTPARRSSAAAIFSAPVRAESSGSIRRTGCRSGVSNGTCSTVRRRQQHRSGLELPRHR